MNANHVNNSMTQRKFSMKRMALKSKFGFTKLNHHYTEEERQVNNLPISKLSKRGTFAFQPGFFHVTQLFGPLT